MRLALLLLGLVAGPAAAQTNGKSLVGLVRDSAGAPIRDVEIGIDSAPPLLRSDSLGQFTISYLAPGQRTVRLERPGLLPMRIRVEIPGDAPETTLSLGEIVLAAAPARTLRVAVGFTDATSGRPVEGVVVSVGRRVVGYGNRAGTFRADSVVLREGDEWSFRRLGFQAVTFDLWPSQEQTSVDLAITLKPVPITLGPVEVRGDVSRALTPWIRDFEQRRRVGRGTFLGEEDIRRHQATISALSLLSWASVLVSGDPWSYSARALRVLGARCYPPGPPLIFLDGVRLEEASASDWLEAFAPEQVAGVEVYSSSAQIPPMFNATGSNCGVIAVWTKR